MPLIAFLGEINTLQGNLNWVASREHSLQHPVWGGREHEFLPLTSSKQVHTLFSHLPKLVGGFVADVDHSRY